MALWSKIDAMEASASAADDPALALQSEALSICEQAGWTPRCIGKQTHGIGVPEIYEELRCLQKVLAVHVSQALIECCRSHDLWTPLFEDVEARIWLFLGDRTRAEDRWRSLLHHSSPTLRDIARKALAALQRKVKSGEMLATEVEQSIDRGQWQRVKELLLDALLAEQPLPNLDRILESTAMRRNMPDHFPWDRGIYNHQFILDLWEHQLTAWEAADAR